MYKNFLIQLIALLVFFTDIFPAQAALKFQVRGTQLDAYVTQAKKDWYRASANGQVPALVSDAGASIFGGSKIDVRDLIGPNAICYPFIGNIGNTGPMTLLVRVVPTFTGNPSRVNTYVYASGSDGQSQGFYIRHNTNGTLNLSIRDRNQSDRINVDSSAYSSAVAGTAMDIWITWDGTANANGVKFYAAQHGNTASLVSQHTASVAFGARDTYAINFICFGLGVFGTGDFYLNEAAIWDEVVDPTSFGARSTFITASAFEGLSYSDPGASSVKTGTSYTYAGVSNTGTYTGSDRWTDPGVANVRSGTAYKADSTSNNRTGTASIPAASNVLVGVAVDATTGTYVGVTAGEVKTGTSFGVGLTGTYDGSDRWTCPIAGQLTTGVQLKCNSTSLNLTGTRDTVTNTMSNATMSGQRTSATLTAQ